ncbi:MAG: aldehyde dehydrogenase, partial [Oscillospiraceae bacterium]|nr:aldehyde dehydrogenase [Oscillospiraceae bacterium]
TCRKELAGHEELEIVGIWDVLLQLGLPEGARRLDRPMALHDACGARGDRETQNAIRSLASALGCELVETPDSGDRSPCCGYGGLAAYANREVAAEMTESCLERSDAPFVSYCMACRDRFARQGRESRHILELIYGTDAGAPPDISEKRYHRLTLRKELLRELWQEETMEETLDFTLLYTDEARQMMDERMILTDDVIAVLQDFRATGEAILDSETGLLIARRRVGNATFWVKFTREGEDAYTVHRAYSHRMRVVKREG